MVPASRAKSFAEEAENSIHDEMKRIAVACFDWLHEKQPMQQGWRKRFDAQVAAFTQITWQICPWEQMGVEAAVEAFEQLCPYQNSPAERLRKIHDLATKGIPPEDRDKRYFSDVAKCKLNNPGFAWPYYYALTDWLLAARRNTRDFLPWITDENQQGSPKDSFSGVEEIIGSEKWWDDAREHPELRFLFRSEDRLGAMNLIKRVWHRAYLADKWIPEDWLREAVRFESVPAVAAAGWKKDMKELMHKNDDFRRRLQSARDAVSAHARNYSIAVPKNDLLLEEWLDAADVELLSMNSWYSQASVDRKVSETVIEQLKNVYNYQPSAADPKLGSPPGYVAVIAFDGDEMGKWVSGESAPPLLEQLSRTAAEYFRDKANVKDEKLQRPLSPSYHLQFSEALSNFGLYLVRPVIEYFNGQLIYSGGDDVLAMVPAASAMDCAEALWLAFRGRKDLAERVKGKFEIEGANGGFVRLTSPLEGQPNWPLVVPGPNAQASVGIAIGHAHSPLQNLVRAAKEAEHRAKTMHGRAASALSLYKRSGEILKWGFKWESPALALFNCFRELSGMNGKPAHFSGRFGYALNDLLAPYRSGTEGRWSKIEDVGGFDQPTVIMKEVVHVVRQQSSDLPDDRRKDFLELCREYLCHLIDKNRPCLADFPMLFSIASFLQRGDE
ncbi:MAG TPA: type III-B CRISPR-associated protein Cas10/Cmr2 [Acidobacteriota bacterium]|nr:type III-B CRISPR-associated protein Cas10/Cmr2 [Acidobacteriota bacterium]